MSYPSHRVSRTTLHRVANRGFTLVELMVTVAVAVLLLGIAAPSFDAVFNSGRIAGQANELVATLQLARMEAVRRNAHVVVCPSTDGATCTGGNPTSWTGWVAFVDDGGFSHAYASGVIGKAGNGTVDANEPILRASTINPKVTVQTSPDISGSAGGAITFHSDGLAYDVNGNLLSGSFGACIATKHPQNNVSYVAISAGSRIAVFNVNGGGTCAVPADAPPSS